MTCPICEKRITVGSGHDRNDARRRALAKHLEVAPHRLGILADYAARYLVQRA